MADSKRFADWYEKARQDFRGAQILFKYGDDYAIVAFHCQQAIEKALKGYILQKSGTLLDGHSLVYLCRRAAKLDEGVKRFMKDCAFVNQFYIETRYPADVTEVLEEEDARECLSTAEEMLGYLEQMK